MSSSTMEFGKPKPITSKTGSKNFMMELQWRQFPDACAVLLEMNGKDVTKELFEKHGFKTPILVRDSVELGVKIPPVTDLNVILKYLVPDLKEVDVIDVERQDTIKMSVVEYFKYMMSPEKSRILNLISMEVSKTRLSEFIEPPKIVRDIDWVHRYWNRSREGHKTYIPSATEKYCLISPSNSFTDFHVDFSGTSVWYHIVTGVKDFFLIRPSTVNNHLFWKWSSSFHKEAQFFGDQADECYKLRITAGETLLLPTGWIHAVYTPTDSLVYGGNFLCTYNVEEQFAVYDMEMKERVVEKYVYPHFRELNWFAAEGLCKEIDSILQVTDVLSVPYHLIKAIRVALPNLKAWSAKLSVQEKSLYNSDQLFKDMNRILRLYERAVAVRNTEKRESTRVKKKPHSDDFILYDDFKVKKALKMQNEEVDQDGVIMPNPSSHAQEPEEDSSSEAWKVKTDATKLSVIIRRCPPSSDLPNQRSDTSTISPGFNTPSVTPRDTRPPHTPVVNPKKLNLSGRKDSPTYRIAASPMKIKTKYTAALLEPRGSLSTPTIRIKSVKDWSSLESSSAYLLSPSSSSEDPKLDSQESLSQRTVEDPLAHSVHQDDEYIYPGLDFSDDEERFKPDNSGMDDKAWSPSNKSLSVVPKVNRPQRVGKTKIAVEKGLEAAAAKQAVFPPRKFIPLPKKPKVRQPKPATLKPAALKPATLKPTTLKPATLKPTAATNPAATNPAAPPKEKQRSTSPKKGTTAKQRLGKILKIHKMRR